MGWMIEGSDMPLVTISFRQAEWDLRLEKKKTKELALGTCVVLAKGNLMLKLAKGKDSKLLTINSINVK